MLTEFLADVVASGGRDEDAPDVPSDHYQRAVRGDDVFALHPSSSRTCTCSTRPPRRTRGSLDRTPPPTSCGRRPARHGSTRSWTVFRTAGRPGWVRPGPSCPEGNASGCPSPGSCPKGPDRAHRRGGVRPRPGERGVGQPGDHEPGPRPGSNRPEIDSTPARRSRSPTVLSTGTVMATGISGGTSIPTAAVPRPRRHVRRPTGRRPPGSTTTRSGDHDRTVRTDSARVSSVRGYGVVRWRSSGSRGSTVHGSFISSTINAAESNEAFVGNAVEPALATWAVQSRGTAKSTSWPPARNPDAGDHRVEMPDRGEDREQRTHVATPSRPVPGRDGAPDQEFARGGPWCRPASQREGHRRVRGAGGEAEAPLRTPAHPGRGRWFSSRGASRRRRRRSRPGAPRRPPAAGSRARLGHTPRSRSRR